jgi:hypothetical protein
MTDTGNDDPVTSAKREYRRFDFRPLRQLTAVLQERAKQLLARLPRTLATDPRLYPRQRQQLVLLTLIMATSLLAMLGLSLRAANGLPPVPALVPPLYVTLDPDATPAPPNATPAPTRSVWWWLSGTPQLGEEEGTPGPQAPESYSIYLPFVLRAEPDPGRLPATQAPEPSAVPPTPNWPNGLDRLTNSKLGLHSIRTNDSYIMEFIRRARPRVVKAVDDLGWLSEVKQVSPNTLTIGRLNSDQGEEMLLKSPVEAANAYIDAQLQRYRLNPGVDVWEGPNEFVPVNDDRMRWYAAFEAHRACRMEELGFRAAVGGFSVGVPEYSQMALFLPALEAAYECNGIFTLHEYNSPTMDCGVTSNKAGIIPGAPNLGDVPVGYHTLRYRFWYEGYLKPLNMGTLPLVISETGVEGRSTPGGPCNDPSGRAWKDYAPWWVQNGQGADKSQAYVQVLSWYDAQLRQDDYVIGATIFTVGAFDGGDAWNPFDIHDALVDLARYAVELR